MTKTRILTLITTILSTSCWLPINTLPGGAPESVCDTMLPFHGGGIPPLTSPPPFRIDPSSNVLGQGQTIQVDVVGAPRELEFGGFMIHARNRNPPYDVVGQFSQSSDGIVKLINCPGGFENAATHVSPSPKTIVSLEWTAPATFLGQVVFNSTVAQSYDKFWVGIPSEPIQIVKREAAPPVIGISSTRSPLSTTKTVFIPEREKTQVQTDPFYDECGKSKTCFGSPDGCLADRSCKSIGSVKVRGDIYEFEIKSGFNSPKYVALGISDDDKMGDDLVTECVSEQGNVAMYSSITGLPSVGVTRTGVPQNSAKLLEASVINGVIYCRVERNPLTNVGGKQFNLLNNKYHLLLAAGSSVKQNGVGYHDLGRLPSGSPINLAVVQDLSGSSTLLFRLHGAFMIAAWIGTTSLGILLARYFKQTWVGSQTCGKDQWFAWHRLCMVTTWSLTMAAFIIIFVQIGGWSAERNPHAILGVITTVLCFLQPIGALFRPAPNSKNRPLFNWMHWLGGNLAHILGIVAIFFAVKLTKAELPDWMDWILVAFVAFHVIVHLIFSIAGCSSDRKANQRVNSFPMSEMAGGRNNMKIERKMDAPHAGFRKGLLAAYIIILILFVVALILIVVLAPIEQSFKNLQSKIKE